MASRVNWTALGVHQWHECENEPSISCSTTVKSLSERVADDVSTDFMFTVWELFVIFRNLRVRSVKDKIILFYSI